MRHMHTSLTDYYKKIEAAARKKNADMEVVHKGLECFDTGKLASLRVGRVEEHIADILEDPDVTKVEVNCIPYNPESAYTVVVKGYHKDGKCPKAILEDMYVSTPTVECELFDADEVIDMRGSGEAQHRSDA